MISQSKLTFVAIVLASSANLFFFTPALADDVNAAKGKAVYEGTCIYCHGDNGKGEIPGSPDFNKTDGVLSKTDEELIRNITEGFESPGADMPMPAKGGNPDLTDEDIANVLTFLKTKFVKEKSK
ncbi:MAG: cytochrome c, class I [Robiginitomaculum sp.]|nr:MAG: cytochrome c, class I [Robiginitomaculum sp.]